MSRVEERLHAPLRLVQFLALTFLSVQAVAAERCETAIARLVSIQGELELRRAGETEWRPANRDQAYCPGDALRTGPDSRAAIQLYPETVVRLDQSSSMVFTPAGTAGGSDWLELLRGAAHLISRDPRFLKIITPFANAAIEGTEFLVEVAAGQTGVTVYEGKVRVANDAGEVAVTSGEQALAPAGAAPFRQALLRPRDAVQWTLYYPPVLFEGSGARRQAAQALAVGRVDEASALLDGLLAAEPDNSDALALQSIIALTRNDKASALELAQRAVTAAPDSATAGIALSYAQQAHFDLSAALASLQAATRHAPDNALAWARLAELELSVGELDAGEAAARTAVDLDPAVARSHTMLGFAWLTRIEPEKAMQAFEQAIARDQAAPLPRLGMGLAKIRRGELEHGRAEIEVAVALDPGNSLLRSYMGKAYYDEKRDRLAGTQYDMARELDPNDPTPWFYDAIRKQTGNRPVEALHDLQTSIALNDNRAVYRSRLELDADLATRSASIARIYRDLGFEQRALVEGWQSVNADPTNYSAHRLLADSYSTQPRHEMARVSELLQSQLLQPLNLTPVQPQLAESNLLILENAGPSDAAFQEYNPLFTRNRLALQANALIGGNETLGDDLVQSGVHDKWSWSVGQFHYESDGYRPNNDQDEDIYNLFVQGALTYRTSIQAELRHRENETGDLRQRFDPDDFLATERNSLDTDTARLGLRHAFSPRSEMIASLFWQQSDDRLSSEVPLGGPFALDARLKGPETGHTLELQHLYRSRMFRLVSGAGYYKADQTERFSFLITPPNLPLPPGFPLPSNQQRRLDENTRHGNAYLYAYVPVTDSLTLTLGSSYDSLEEDEEVDTTVNGILLPPGKSDLDIDKLNPKLGISWRFTPDTTLRAAAFRVVRRSAISNQTIEPTQVAGFNQFFDEATGTVAKRYGAALDHEFTSDLSAGVEYSQRDLTTHYQLLDYEHVDWEERLGRAYLYWTPHPRLAASAEYQYERFARDPEFTGEIQATRIRTNKLPLSVRYFNPNGISAGLEATYIDQEGDFSGGPAVVTGAATTSDDDRFWVVDAALGYRLPKRRGMISVGVSNLFDESFNFVDTDTFNPTIYPERLLFGRLTLVF